MVNESSGRLRSHNRPSVQLLRTCRQIYYEASVLPVSLNYFHVFKTATMSSMSKHFALGQRRAIKTLTVTLEVARWFLWRHQARRFEKLEKMIVWLTAEEEGDFSRLAQAILKMMKKNKNLRIIFKTSKPFPRLRPKTRLKRRQEVCMLWLSERLLSREDSN